MSLFNLHIQDAHLGDGERTLLKLNECAKQVTAVYLPRLQIVRFHKAEMRNATPALSNKRFLQDQLSRVVEMHERLDLPVPSPERLAEIRQAIERL